MCRNAERGAAAVEFALLANVIFLILFGTIEFGFALYAQQAVVNASREGARAGTVFQMVGGVPTKASDSDIKLAVAASLAAMGLKATPKVTLCDVVVPPVVTCGVALQNLTGQPTVLLAVTVSYPYVSITGLQTLLGIPNPMNLTASTVMMHE